MNRLPSLALAFLGLLAVSLQANQKPNVLILYADDLGYGGIGAYGGKEVPTPHIDSLAAYGVRMTSGYVSAPLCSPSRAGMMTGRYQQRFRHDNNNQAPGGMPLTEVTIADRMKALGYATLAVGKWHLGGREERLPQRRGFDEFYGVVANGPYIGRPVMDSLLSNKEQKTPKEFYTTDAFALRACDFIAKNQEKPWFIYLAFNAVHGPYEATQNYLDRFPHVKRPDRRHFCGMLAAMDDGVGLVLAKLRELGLEENTLIFFISDNGSPHLGDNGGLRGTKYKTWEGGIRIPWMVQWKGKLPAGKVYDFPVVQLDVMPTCVRAAGGTVDPAWQLDGVDLVPYLTGLTAGRPHESLYWRIDGRWAVRQGDMKLVVGEPDHKPELFDLATDRNESKDLAAAQPAKVAELTALWQNWNKALPPPPAPTKKGKKGMEE